MNALRQTAFLSYLALIGLTISWEGWFAPSSYAPRAWFMLKTLPLILLLYGLVRGTFKSYFLACIVVLVYFAEGTVLTYVYVGTHWQWTGTRFFAILEILLSLSFFFSAAWYVRQSRDALSRPLHNP